MSKKVARQFVDEISKAGIKHLYAVTGDSLNAVNNAVSTSKDVEWVHVRHEESGAFAACAEAFLNGIGCCAGSSGPGHIHLINGLYDADHGNCPVLVLASTCGSYEFGTQYFQETNPTKLFDDCSCYNQVATTPTQFSRMLPAALRHAVCEKRVAVVSLPGDVADMDAVDSPPSLPVNSVSTYTPPAADVQKLADLIAVSKKITIYCGIGAADAHDEVVALASKIKAPVGSTFRGKMAIQYNNPYYIGLTGLLGLPAAYISMFDSDLLIMLGTDFPFTPFLPQKCAVAQVDIRPERIGRRTQVSLPLAGSVKDTLAALLPLVAEKEDDSFLTQHMKIYTNSLHDMENIAKSKGSKDLIAPEYLTTLLDKYASEDAIFTVDTGMCCSWSARYINAIGKREILASYSHGSMCNSLPMSIGAAFARPNQQVVAMCGDGGLSMILGELATVFQYKLANKIIVFNNRSLGLVKLEMEMAGLPYTQTEMVNPDFSKVGEAMGIKSYRVDDPEELDGVLKEAFAYDGAVLVDVLTDSNAMTIPPTITANQIYGFTTAFGRMILSGHSDEFVNIVKSNLKLLL